jgi:mono/diheme cytochrome c family protein
MLKSFFLFTAVVLLFAASASAPAQNAAKTAPDSHARAKKLYELDCALCHGSSGDGKTDLAKDMQLTLLDWTDPKALASLSDQQLFDAIRKGKGKMPPEDEGRAKNEEIKNLVTYIRKLAKDQPATPAAAAPAPDAAPADAPAATPPPAAPPATPAPGRK